MVLSSFSLASLLNQIQLSDIWPYVLLAFLVAVEGPLATLGAAVASSTGYLDPRLVFLSACCGNLSADVIWYTVGFMGKLDLLERYGRWFGFKPSIILKVKQDMHDHVGKFLFVAKLTLGLVVPTLIAAGLAHISWRRWIVPLVSAETLWTGGLVLVGYYYGQYVLQLENGLKLFSIGATLILIIVVGIYILRRRVREEKT